MFDFVRVWSEKTDYLHDARCGRRDLQSSIVYRVLKAAGLLAGPSPVPSKKLIGFDRPLAPHEHWHVDVSYLNISGTFFFLFSVLDGCSRFIVHWEIGEKMEE